MRAVADASRVRELMRALGRTAREPASIYFTGGATAVLHGWRATTVDVDLRFEPERDELFRALAELKERLSINLELASPQEFVPVATDWRSRSPFIGREGRLSFFHFDPHAQALFKGERHHAQDVDDVQAMLRLGLITAEGMLRYFERVEPRLFRYPAIDAASLRQAVEDAFGPASPAGDELPPAPPEP